MLQEILDHHVPDSWQASTYQGYRYKLVELSSRDEEYQQVTAAFQEMEINRIVRVQNPFIYGRYKIRKEYLALSGSVREKTVYHPVAAVDVVKVAEYNCDTRRYAGPNRAQKEGKNPQFYSTPQAAFETFQAVGSASGVAIVVIKLLNADNAWDSQYSPEYAVYLD